MFTATKSFERFRQPKSVQDEKKSVDNAIPKSTAYKTVVLFFLFKEHNGYPHPYNRRIRVAHKGHAAN